MVETRRIVEWLQACSPSSHFRASGRGTPDCAPARLTKVKSPRSWRPGSRRSGAKSSVRTSIRAVRIPTASGAGKSTAGSSVDVHIDTVGVETMIGDPFDGRLENGRVYGRDSVDTKASLGVVLALLEDMQRRGEVLKPNLVVCASSDEETGCGGAPVFAQWVRRRGLKLDQLLVAEPTMCAPIYGHKGASNVIFEIQGEAAHSSKPHLGKNAIVAAAPLVTALAAEHERVSQLQPSTDVGAPTLAVVMISGGQALNIVPDKCQIYVNRRVVAGRRPGDDQRGARSLRASALSAAADHDDCQRAACLLSVARHALNSSVERLVGDGGGDRALRDERLGLQRPSARGRHLRPRLHRSGAPRHRVDRRGRAGESRGYLHPLVGHRLTHQAIVTGTWFGASRGCGLPQHRRQ